MYGSKLKVDGNEGCRWKIVAERRISGYKILNEAKVETISEWGHSLLAVVPISLLGQLVDISHGDTFCFDSRPPVRRLTSVIRLMILCSLSIASASICSMNSLISSMLSVKSSFAST